MSLIPLRVELAVITGIATASLLSASFMGCQSSPSNQTPGGQYGQYSRGPNGQPLGSYASTQGQYAGAGTGMNPAANPTQQAFMAETQRLGGQQNLSAQDVVAMQRSGMSNEQIATAIQQRGGNLKGTPGIPEYLAQNGVNPGVMDGVHQPGGSPMPQYGGQPMPQYGGQMMSTGIASGMPASMQPGMQPGSPVGMPGGVQQSGGFPTANVGGQPAMVQSPFSTDTPAIQPAAFDAPAGATGDPSGGYGAATPQAWRSKNP